MKQLKASPDIVVVDKDAGQTSGTSEIKYLKERSQELWENLSGTGWNLINVHVRTGLGDIADISASFMIKLVPGDGYEIGIFEADHGPLSTDPIQIEDLIVHCLLKKPENKKLITDENQGTGGTWHWHQIATKVPTSIVQIGLSLKPSVTGADGIPRLFDLVGSPTLPLQVTNNHIVEINPLFPGNHYFFAVLVKDGSGNWDFRLEEIDTLRRKLTVEFKTIHIYNDGDPGSYGEGEFWFKVSEGNQMIQEFHLPTQDIDDWNETDRPYSVGFAHLGTLKSISPGQEKVSIMSYGIEHDGIFDSDESAGALSVPLPIPAGRFIETVLNSNFTMDCPVMTVDDDFHYGVDIQWSVEYLS